MDFLNQAFAQIRDLFLSMTPAARVTSVLLVAVIGVSLGFLVKQNGAGPEAYLFNGESLRPADADRVEAAIAQAGLNGWERNGNRIMVPRSQMAEYLGAVADAGALPPNHDSIILQALDLGPFVDDKTRRERLKAAREQQLSMIIRAMDGIEEAKVIYDVTEARGLSRAAQASATVSVRPAPGRSLDPQRTKLIRKAVAGAIANLNIDDVTVINLGDGNTFGDEISPESFDTPYFQHRVAFERQMQGKIEKLLMHIPGVQVQVTAELSPTLTAETRTIAAEGEATALRESNQEKVIDTQHLNKGGRPGLVAQGPGRGAEGVNEVTVKNTESDTQSEQNYFVPTKDELTTQAGLVPEHVRAAVAVPTGYLISMYREQQRRKGEDPNQPLPTDINTTLEVYKKDVEDSVKAAVVPLLPKELAQYNLSDVVVSFFETLTPETIEEPSIASDALVWTSQNFNTLTMSGLVLVGLVMLRSLVKGLPTPEPLTAVANPTLTIAGGTGSTTNDKSESSEEEQEADEERPRLRLKKGTSLRDELTAIVKEDPDSAAAILRTWISNAS
jgi:flagellar M-ring protein FliF